MELGSLFKDEEWSAHRIAPKTLASIVHQLLRKQITSRSAKSLLLMKFEGDVRDVEQIIQDEGLTLKPLSRQEYLDLAKTLLDEKPDMVKDILEKGHGKKIKWFVGQMMARSAEGTVEPDTAEAILKEQLGVS
jgi:aspartyl-tRNA(Asn)/glutamyl-tRNA(Gln) amidotransferase subunit B